MGETFQNTRVKINRKDIDAILSGVVYGKKNGHNLIRRPTWSEIDKSVERYVERISEGNPDEDKIRSMIAARESVMRTGNLTAEEKNRLARKIQRLLDALSVVSVGGPYRMNRHGEILGRCMVAT